MNSPQRFGKRFFLIILAFVCFACSQSSTVTNNTINTVTSDTLFVSMKGLPYLGNNYVYEAWIVYGSSYVSIGRFSNINRSTDPSISFRDIDTTFRVGKDTLAYVTGFVLSIEPTKDDSYSISSVRLLAGDFSSGTATAVLSDVRALGNNFITELRNASIKYLFASPTDGNRTVNETSGVWFIDSLNGAATAGIKGLPNLPSGWKYEAWLVKYGNRIIVTDPTKVAYPLSMGKFIAATGMDDAHLYSGDSLSLTPRFPGEDFLKSTPVGFTPSFPYPIVPNQDVIILSIEPNPDDDLGIFALKPFIALISDTTQHQAHSMGYVLSVDSRLPEPKATITIK